MMHLFITREGNRKSIHEMDWEAQKAVETAVKLVEGKTGFKTSFETWRYCDLIITIGHNIYTTQIELRPPEQEIIRKINWHNGYAYFCNGIFWANWSQINIELI